MKVCIFSQSTTKLIASSFNRLYIQPLCVEQVSKKFGSLHTYQNSLTSKVSKFSAVRKMGRQGSFSGLFHPRLYNIIMILINITIWHKYYVVQY